MIALILSSVVAIVLLCDDGLTQETSGSITAQTICDSLGSVGLYSNPDDTTCKQYAKCLRSNDALIGAFYNCTGSTFFDPHLQYCTTSFTCEATSTTTSTEATTATTETTTEVITTTPDSTATTSTPNTAQNVCDSQNAVGRYPNPDDKSCQQYALCFENNGSLAGSFYNCTGTTLFDPSLQLCKSGYVCGE